MYWTCVRITNTCRCDTTWTSAVFLWNTAGTTHKGNGPFLPDRNRNVYHSIETLELTNIHSPLYCLDGWCLALHRRWHIRAGITNSLSMYWTCEAVTVRTPKSHAPVSITTDVHDLGTCLCITTTCTSTIDDIESHAFQPSEPAKSISLSKCPVYPTSA